MLKTTGGVYQPTRTVIYNQITKAQNVKFNIFIYSLHFVDVHFKLYLCLCTSNYKNYTDRRSVFSSINITWPGRNSLVRFFFSCFVLSIQSCMAICKQTMYSSIYYFFSILKTIIFYRFVDQNLKIGQSLFSIWK